MQKQSRERFKTKQEAERLDEEFQQLSPSEANQRLSEIKQESPELYEKVRDVATARKKNLDRQDRLIQYLGVTNGQRANYIHEQAQKLNNKEEKNDYIAELREKGLVSKKVMDQLRELAK